MLCVYGVCDFFADDESMGEARNPSTNAPQSMSMNMSSKQLDTSGGGGGGAGTDDDDSDVDDSPAPFLSRVGSGGKQSQLPHPLKRSATSPVDEKVEDWLRTSRHRLLADASVGAAQDQCRAITVYNPLPLPGGATTGEEDEAGGDGEAGGDPTPSPGVTGNDGDERAAVSAFCAASSSSGSPASALNTAQVCSAAGGAGLGAVQSAGSGTAEAATTGSCGGDRNCGRSGGDHVFRGGGVGPRGLQTGGGLAHSAADIAAGPMTDEDDEVGNGGATVSSVAPTTGALIAATSVNDAMEDDEAMGVLPEMSTQPELTRVGTSRGVPTPEITPQWVALARVSCWRSFCSLFFL